MALHWKLRTLLWLNSLRKQPDLNKVDPARFRAFNRKATEELKKLVQYPPEPMHELAQISIPAPDGYAIPARVYRPSAQAGLPVLVYFHGGGFVIGDLDSHDGQCRRLAAQAQCVVIAVDYRLAPEYKFPQAPEDCYTAVCWIAQNAETLQIDSTRIAVAGDSAGGNLATVVCLMSRDRNGPAIAQQILIYPCTDATMSFPSIKKLTKGYILTEELMDWFLRQYIREGTDKKDPLLSPFWSENLSNLPPALVITAEFDPLKDEGAAYAEKLRKAGNEVVSEEYKGMIHVFFQMPKFLKAARKAEQQIVASLSKALVINKLNIEVNS